MGRGRKGILDQSKKTKASGGLRGRRGDTMGHFLYGPKTEEKKISINEDALEFMKNMNQQELVYFLFGGEEMRCIDIWHST